jgi:DNA-directed RNA polymerase
MELLRRVQQARYEDFVLTLASAYDGYKCYLPAFMDFRGRIYRAGVLHYHERDLSRSLLLFSSDTTEEELRKRDDLSYLRNQLASFKYKKFGSLDQSLLWYNNTKESLNLHSDESLIDFARNASDPFQFLAKVLSNERVCDLSYLNRVPVTQDASASAYQIMSYLLLNAQMGRRTNLLPSPQNGIQDLYLCLKDELQEFFHERLDKNKYAIIESQLTRNLVKQIFMPLIYGKTVHTMADDIRKFYGSLLSFKDNYNIAALCHLFWREKYPDISNLMKLINLIGWFCSVLGKPVLYSVEYFTTVQDYMRSDKAEIWVNDRVCKKKRRVTLRIPTLARDSRKTQVSTCVNFIHQKDAFIAMKVVDKLTETMNAPIYTVHDNFITTSVSAAGVPHIYTQVFMEMGPPLQLINEFLFINLIQLSNEPYPFPLYSDPIPGDYLRTHLISLEPKDLKKKWVNKIDDLVSCYEEYVNTVCGGKLHAEKWNEFQSLLKSWESLEFNYSVHY